MEAEEKGGKKADTKEKEEAEKGFMGKAAKEKAGARGPLGTKVLASIVAKGATKRSSAEDQHKTHKPRTPCSNKHNRSKLSQIGSNRINKQELSEAYAI